MYEYSTEVSPEISNYTVSNVEPSLLFKTYMIMLEPEYTMLIILAYVPS